MLAKPPVALTKLRITNADLQGIKRSLDSITSALLTISIQSGARFA